MLLRGGSWGVQFVFWGLLNVKIGKLLLMRASLKPQGFTLLIAGIAALGAALVIAPVLAYGPRLDGDSLTYVTIANNLLAGLGYTDLRGHPNFNHAPVDNK